MVSILRSNLPDAAEALVNRGEQNQRPKSIKEDPSPELKTETIPIEAGPSRANPPPPIFVPGRDIPSNPLPTPSPKRYIHQDLPIHPGFDHAPASISPQVKRKRQDSGSADVPSSLSPTTMGYYSPIFVGSQPFMTEPYADLLGFPSQGVPVPAQSVPPQDILPGHPVPEQFGESMEQYGFPYNFEH